MKIGVYTIHDPFNYGAVFQTYATQEAIKKLGYDVEIVNYSVEKLAKSKFSLKNFIIKLYAELHPKTRKKLKRCIHFHKNKLQLSAVKDITDFYQNPPVYDIHLVGSDQVWNLEAGLMGNAFFFLDFLKNDQKQISYASSFGTSTIDAKFKPIVKPLFEKFSNIAVREHDGVEIIQSLGVSASQVLDPTFLLSAQEWEKLNLGKPLLNFDYVFYYGFDKSTDTEEMLSAIKARLGMPVIAVSVGHFFPYKVDQFRKDPGPIEFLNLLKYSKFVCTSSYHGACFSIHFRKSFFCNIHKTRNSRFEALLKNFNLQSRQLKDTSSIRKFTDAELYIDYATLEPTIQAKTNESFQWLRNAIETAK